MNSKFLVMIKQEQLLTNKAIANKIGVDEKTISAWINNEMQIPEDKANLIEEYFGKERSILSSYKHSTSIIISFTLINIISISLVMVFQLLNKLQINGAVFLLPFALVSLLIGFLFYKKKLSYILIPLFLIDLILIIYLFACYPLEINN